MMELPAGRKSFKIGLAVLIQYRRVTARHPASHVAIALYRVLRRADKNMRAVAFASTLLRVCVIMETRLKAEITRETMLRNIVSRVYSARFSAPRSNIPCSAPVDLFIAHVYRTQRLHFVPRADGTVITGTCLCNRSSVSSSRQKSAQPDRQRPITCN